jgi:hypothetical protein
MSLPCKNLIGKMHVIQLYVQYHDINAQFLQFAGYPHVIRVIMSDDQVTYVIYPDTRGFYGAEKSVQRSGVIGIYQQSAGSPWYEECIRVSVSELLHARSPSVSGIILILIISIQYGYCKNNDP